MERLREAISDLVASDPSCLADAQSIERLHRELERLDAVTTRAVGRFDADQAWADDGARSAAAWVAWKMQLPATTAKRRVWLGRCLRDMPATEEAWTSGRVSSAHVAALARARSKTDATVAAFARDETVLVGHAIGLRYVHFQRALDYWVQRADPDGDDKNAAKLHEERRAHFAPGFEGTATLDALFDPIGAAIFGNELKRREDELFEHDWNEAKAALGRDPLTHELGRTHAQRRHDALVEMATRSASMPPGARKPAPLFTVLVGWETLSGRICELANGTVLSPSALVPWLTQADFERVVFEPPSRVIDVGVQRRLFEGATRRAVEVRDRECFHETCDERVDLQVDHIQPYSWGGPTETANGRPACPHHNRGRHKRRRRPGPGP